MKEQLVEKSADAAQRAIRHYLNKEYDQFFVQASVSFELLGKARLAAIHPSLIVDKDFDSLLHACAAGKHSKRPPWNIKSITASEVLKRCTQLQPELKSYELRLMTLADYRSSVVHLGEVPEAEVTELLRAYLAAASAVAKWLGLKPVEMFGEFAEMVSKQLDESLARVQRLVAEKLALAKDNFKQRFAGLDTDQLQALIKLTENRYPLTKYESDLLPCPGCGNLGMVSGSYDVDWEPEYDDRSGDVTGAYPVVTLRASGFDCNLCGLALDSSFELEAAGLESSINVEEVDAADFYEEPDA